MARATRLRIYSQDEPEGGDERTEDRFPAALPPVAPDSQLGADVLALLKRDTQQALRQADHADATASNALYTAQTTSTEVAKLTADAEALTARTNAVEATAREIGTQALAAVELAQKQRGAGIAAGVSMAHQFLLLLLQVIGYVLDRAPALLALGAAVWLWSSVLDDPTVLRLIALGMFGVLVMGPVMWLSWRGKGAGNAG